MAGNPRYLRRLCRIAIKPAAPISIVLITESNMINQMLIESVVVISSPYWVLREGHAGIADRDWKLFIVLLWQILVVKHFGKMVFISDIRINLFRIGPGVGSQE